VQSQPNGVLLKMRGKKLRSDVNWLGTSKQKWCKTGVKQGLRVIIFLTAQIVTVTIHNVGKSASDIEYKSRSFG
jgi:hypothetical protein